MELKENEVKQRLSIKDITKAKIEYLKDWAKRHEDDLKASAIIAATGIGGAAIGFISGRINGYFGGLEDGMNLGIEYGKADEKANVAERLVENLLLSAMKNDANEDVK